MEHFAVFPGWLLVSSAETAVVQIRQGYGSLQVAAQQLPHRETQLVSRVQKDFMLYRRCAGHSVHAKSPLTWTMWVCFSCFTKEQYHEGLKQMFDPDTFYG
jgi:hypothetical protein